MRNKKLWEEHERLQKEMFDAEKELNDFNINSARAKSKYWHEKYNFWKHKQSMLLYPDSSEVLKERNILFYLEKYDKELELITSKKEELKKLKKLKRSAWKAYLNSKE